MAECRLARVAWEPSGVACTMKLARRLVPELSSYRLASVADRLGVRFDGRAHRAEADARVVAEVTSRLREIVTTRHGLSDIDPLMLVELGRQPGSGVTQFLERAARGRGTRL